MDNRKSTLWTIICIIVLTLSVSLSATIRDNVSIVREKSIINIDNNNESALKSSSAVYTGKIKVHIIEPDSRWIDYTGVHYDNAHLFYAVLANFTAPEAGIWDTTVTIDAASYGFPGVTVDNIGSAVAVFTDNDVLCDADPPNGNWFNANYADASAMAYPGIKGENETKPGFTHSVFIEEGTATW